MILLFILFFAVPIGIAMGFAFSNNDWKIRKKIYLIITGILVFSIVYSTLKSSSEASVPMIILISFSIICLITMGIKEIFKD